jgi:hypothetical protein
MKRLLAILTTAVILAGLGLGCGGDTGKGIHSTHDKPKPANQRN